MSTNDQKGEKHMKDMKKFIPVISEAVILLVYGIKEKLMRSDRKKQ